MRKAEMNEHNLTQTERNAEREYVAERYRVIARLKSGNTRVAQSQSVLLEMRDHRFKILRRKLKLIVISALIA